MLAGAALDLSPKQVVRLKAGRLVAAAPFSICRIHAACADARVVEQVRTVLLLDAVGCVAANQCLGLAQPFVVRHSRAQALFALVSRQQGDVVSAFNWEIGEACDAAYEIAQAEGFEQIWAVADQVRRGAMREFRLTASDALRAAAWQYVGSASLRH